MTETYNEDCLIGMSRIADGSVDCIICDLPYGTTACYWDSIIPFEPLWEQYKRIIKPKGAIVLFATEPFTSNLICSNIKQFREKLTWVKHKPSNIGNAKYMHLKYSEDIVVFADGKCTYNPKCNLAFRIGLDKHKKVIVNNGEQTERKRKRFRLPHNTSREIGTLLMLIGSIRAML